MCRLMAEWYDTKWYDTKSNVKLGGFQSQLEASYVFSYTEELFHKTVCLWMIYIYIYIYILYTQAASLYLYMLHKSSFTLIFNLPKPFNGSSKDYYG